MPGGSEDLSTSDVPLFWTTLGLVLGDHNEAGSLGFWSAHKEKRILRLSSSAAVITHQQNNNLDCHRIADDQTFDLSFQSSAGRIDLEADGYLCDISQFGHGLDCPEKNQIKHVQAPASALAAAAAHPSNSHFKIYKLPLNLRILSNDPR